MNTAEGAEEGRSIGTTLGTRGDLVDIAAGTTVQVLDRREIELRKPGRIEMVRVVAPAESIGGVEAGIQRASHIPGYWVMDAKEHPYEEAMPSINCLRDEEPDNRALENRRGFPDCLTRESPKGRLLKWAGGRPDLMSV